ncbi:MAG: ATP-binding cassette domain-containing protein [Gemmatimonadetes bacterium]|nr:ABC transporter ATP-binding protein [Gemmatimonadota bacterium]NIR79793.1 ABC transporter ATP-binding protein [Gemmatimonadota bacterium]NIT88496.1 ABC transporter ATP-binding protein [Gemmatimonadota bacterium]NIU32319.1 ABC transporter ATP-binding protein [Gemmatimonadota bacterium]NIU36841.1 ATP-binding cassette domain-containing protein [Gemmatimonadota bacterium]
MSEHLLDVRELRVHFELEEGTARAVDGLSLRLEAGEALGLVGESGCGKTVTCLSLLGLLESPPARILPGSSIRLRGEELVGASPDALRRVRGGGIAMIFQEPGTSLNPVLTVGAQIAEVLREHRDLDRRELRDVAADLLGEVGIPEAEERLDAHPHQLSGGMRQRVMIAMALACDPRILVADEPTTALDVTIQAQILALLDRIRRERGMALILVSHDLAVVAQVCERVAVMYGGRAVEMGPADSVFSRPRHPYTEGLLASIPGTGRAPGELQAIPGSVPAPTAWPSGCRFRDRCAHAWGRCAEDEPPLLAPEETARDHRARCWLVEEPGRRGRARVSGGDGR